jgi:hypothetical protein
MDRPGGTVGGHDDGVTGGGEERVAGVAGRRPNGGPRCSD